MATIMVPTMAAFERDLTTNLRLLEKIVKPAGHEIGLEIIGEPVNFIEREQRQKMVHNLKKYATGLKIISHQWGGNIIHNPSLDNVAFADLRTERGRKIIHYGVSFAQEAIDAGIIPYGKDIYVHFHAGELYFGERMSNIDLDRQRKLILEPLLSATMKNPCIIIGLENLPLFPDCDDPSTIDTPEKVGRNVFESLLDYRRAVEGTKLRFTFDTAHLAYDFPKVDLISAIDTLGEYLRHIHISDGKGPWIPYRLVPQDGYVPGEGNIGREEFQRFFRYLKDNCDLSEVSIEAEVRDMDYSNPVNKEETLKRIVNWLN